MPASRAYAPALWVCLGLFAARVAGQAVVAVREVSWLPPMAHWYSGLLPYPLLLPVQILILALMLAIGAGFTRGRGVFVEPRPRLGRSVQAFAVLYAAGMGVRYAVTMWLFPERRWLGPGTIPIVFHWVLATFLLVFARYHVRQGQA